MAMVWLIHINSGSVTSLQQSTPTPTDPIEGEEGEGASSQHTTKDKDKVYCAATKLSRLLFVLGQGALCTLIYTEKLGTHTYTCPLAVHSHNTPSLITHPVSIHTLSAHNRNTLSMYTPLLYN